MSDLRFEDLPDVDAELYARTFGIRWWQDRADLNSLWNRDRAGWRFEVDGTEVTARPPAYPKA